MLIGMDWIQKTDMTIKKEKVKLNTIKNEISNWLRDLKKVFETISEEELPLSREEVDYKITLKTKEIKLLSLIVTRSEEQQIIKEYLNKMLRKE